MSEQLGVAKTVLFQAVELLDKHLTSDEQLTVHSKYLPGSTIGKKLVHDRSDLQIHYDFDLGKHFRHARDHYTLLLDCMQSAAPRELSYDTRIRNTPMETSREGARVALLDTVKRLEELVPTTNFDEEITLHAITPHMHSFQTTIGREVSNSSFLV